MFDPFSGRSFHFVFLTFPVRCVMQESLESIPGEIIAAVRVHLGNYRPAGRGGAMRQVEKDGASILTLLRLRGDLKESRRVLRISNMVFFAEIGTMSSLDCVGTIFPLLMDPGQTDRQTSKQ